MEVALICYHKNINTVYPQVWIDRYRDSILGQTFTDFDIYECDYGGDGNKIFDAKYYINKQFPTFNHAQNFLIDWAFTNGAERVANSNCDDYFHPLWLETELKHNYDLVSCNFSLVKDDKVYHNHSFHCQNIKECLYKNNNIVAHPAVIYSKNFWSKHRYIPEEIPAEDLMLWKRAINDCTFFICEENLLFHRVHGNMVSRADNDRKEIV